MDNKIEEYLQQGMFGPRETKPEERALFLGTIRERIFIALTKGQVYHKKVYSEISSKMNTITNGELLLNGEIDYSFLSKYIKLANEKKIPFKVVTDLDKDTSIGLVLASKTAVDEEEIFIRDEIFERAMKKSNE